MVAICSAYDGNRKLNFKVALLYGHGFVGLSAVSTHDSLWNSPAKGLRQ